MFTITLNDGTKLKDLGLNGNNFVSKTEIKDKVFEGNLDTVIIYDSEIKETQTLNDAVLIQNKQYGEEWWFILAEKPQSQKDAEEIATNITNIEVALADVYEMIVGGE